MNEKPLHNESANYFRLPCSLSLPTSTSTSPPQAGTFTNERHSILKMPFHYKHSLAPREANEKQFFLLLRPPSDAISEASAAKSSSSLMMNTHRQAPLMRLIAEVIFSLLAQKSVCHSRMNDMQASNNEKGKPKKFIWCCS